jgi:hypothetical protein
MACALLGQGPRQQRLQRPNPGQEIWEDFSVQVTVLAGNGKMRRGADEVAGLEGRPTVFGLSTQVGVEMWRNRAHQGQAPHRQGTSEPRGRAKMRCKMQERARSCGTLPSVGL